jgi:hypothetical protein
MTQQAWLILAGLLIVAAGIALGTVKRLRLTAWLLAGAGATFIS